MHLLFWLFFLLICLITSSFFSGAETGFVSWSPFKVSHRASQGDPLAKIALYLVKNPDRVISATLIGNNISLIGATLSFTKVFEIVASTVSIDIKNIPSPESWILTPVMVLFCEMLPKSLFRTYSFRLTMRSIPFLFITYTLTFPFTWLITLITKSFLNHQKSLSQDSFTAKVREEMVLIAGEGSRRGTLFESADKYIHRVLNLKDLSVADLMVGVNEMRARYQMFSSSCLAGELKSRGLQDDEVIVTDETTGIPLGTVDLVDVVAGTDATPLIKYIKPFLKITASTNLLAVLQDGVKVVSNYISIIDDNGNMSGLVEKITLFRAVFGGFETNLNDI